MERTPSGLGRTLGLVVLLIGMVVATGGVNAAQSPTANEGAPTADNTITQIEVHADGSAEWVVRVRTRLSNDAEVAGFERYQERIRADRSSQLSGFRSSMEAIVARAGGATSREMAATNFTITTSIRRVPRDLGVVTYRFTWEGFARQDGDALLVADAFQDGYYITADDTLLLAAPDGYEVDSVQPPPDERRNDTVIWRGQVTFGPDRPSIRMAPTSTDGGLLSLWPWVAIPLGVLLLGLLGVYGYKQRDGANEPVQGEGGSPAGATTAGVSRQPIQSDADRLLAIVEDHGGQMRQAAIVESVDWSKSKVSRLVSDLAEEDQLEKIRLGRENVVTIPEDEAEDAADRD